MRLIILTVLLLLSAINATLLEPRWGQPDQQYQDCYDTIRQYRHERRFCRRYLSGALPPQNTSTATATSTVFSPASTTATVSTTISSTTVVTRTRTRTSIVSTTATATVSTVVTTTVKSTLLTAETPTGTALTTVAATTVAATTADTTAAVTSPTGTTNTPRKRGEATPVAALEARRHHYHQNVHDFDPSMISKACFSILYSSTERPATTTTVTSTVSSQSPVSTVTVTSTDIETDRARTRITVTSTSTVTTTTVTKTSSATATSTVTQTVPSNCDTANTTGDCSDGNCNCDASVSGSQYCNNVASFHCRKNRCTKNDDCKNGFCSTTTDCSKPVCIPFSSVCPNPKTKRGLIGRDHKVIQARGFSSRRNKMSRRKFLGNLVSSDTE